MTHKPFVRHAIAALALFGVVAPVASSPVFAQANDGQGEARRELRAGNVKTLREIESRVLPQMRGMDYLGPDDFSASTYRLKFIRDGRVVFVDVDARSGRIIKVMR